MNRARTRPYTGMRTRLGVLLLIAIFAGAGYVALGRGGEPTSGLVETLATSSPEWRRAKLYLVRSHSRFPAPAPPGQFERNTYRNEQRLRILLLGESYTYDWALADPDARWSIGDEASGYTLLLAVRHVDGYALEDSRIDVFDGVVLNTETAEN